MDNKKKYSKHEKMVIRGADTERRENGRSTEGLKKRKVGRR